MARQDDQAALAALQDCWRDPHTRQQAHQVAAEAWQRLGDSPRAEKMLAQARQLPADLSWPDPLVEEVNRLVTGVRPRLDQAAHLEQQGQPHEAVRVLQQIIADNPREASAWLLLGQLLRQQGQLGQAEGALAQVVEVNPGSVEGWFHLGVVRALRHQTGEAAAAFRQVVRLKPDHTLAHYNLGLCLRNSDREGARAALKMALRCQPDYEPARKALAELDSNIDKKQ
jgi:tetratricopeptide (TPR) repeat protein